MIHGPSTFSLRTRGGLCNPKLAFLLACSQYSESLVTGNEVVHSRSPNPSCIGVHVHVRHKRHGIMSVHPISGYQVANFSHILTYLSGGIQRRIESSASPEPRVNFRQVLMSRMIELQTRHMHSGPSRALLSLLLVPASIQMTFTSLQLLPFSVNPLSLIVDIRTTFSPSNTIAQLKIHSAVM